MEHRRSELCLRQRERWRPQLVERYPCGVQEERGGRVENRSERYEGWEEVRKRDKKDGGVNRTSLGLLVNLAFQRDDGSFHLRRRL